MDLPTCPSCRQSVLDDDAAECPFCGASMTAKPGAKPAAAAPTAPQKQSAAQQKPAAGKTANDDDNPFGVAPSVTGKSIQLLAKPAKGRLHRVICPMCETPGFHSKQVAGKEVRCANQECLVPIFTAPRPEGAEPEEAPRAEPEAKSSSSIGLMAAIVVVAAAAIGGGAWFATSGGGSDEQQPFQLPDVKPRNGTAKANGNGTGTDPKTPENGTKQKTVEPAGPTYEELLASSLQRMVTDSQDQQNQRKGLSRKLTAEAYAMRGNLDELNTQLKQLQIVAPRQQYLGIIPLVTMAWHDLASGDSIAAGGMADRALEVAKQLPDFGSDALDAATELATLLVALNRDSEAEAILKPRTNNEALGQLMEALARAKATATGNVDLAVKTRPVTLWAAPQRVAVTTGLTGRGFAARALAWAKASEDPHTVAQCVSAWGEVRILSGDAGALAEIEQQLVGFSPSRRAMVLSRLAFALHNSGQSQAAEATLAKAQAELKSAGTPNPKPFPTLRAIYEFKLEDTSPIREKAIAAAEVAHTQALLGRGNVWETITLALNFARSMGQSPVAAQRALDEPQLGVTERLKTEFNLQTANEAIDAYKKYRTGCNRVKSAADAQFRLQYEILAAACDWGLVDEVWEEIRTQTKPTGGGLPHELWFETRIPSIIHTHYRGAQDAAKVNMVESTVTKARLSENAFPRMTYQLRSDILAAGAKPGDAARLLDKFPPGDEADSRWAFETKLRLATRLAADRPPADAFSFVESMSQDDPIPRQAAFEFVAAQITASGNRKAVPAYIETARLRPEDRVALLRGFVGALKPDVIVPGVSTPIGNSQ